MPHNPQSRDAESLGLVVGFYRCLPENVLVALCQDGSMSEFTRDAIERAELPGAIVVTA